MHIVEVANASDYLRRTGRIGPCERVSVHELAGGVSNCVLYVSRSEGDDFVLKQARQQLRVPQPWFCTPERIFRETQVIRLCKEQLERTATALLPADEVDTDGGGEGPTTLTENSFAQVDVSVPKILFEDRENYLFAMEAAPQDHETWKVQLLWSEASPEIARACGVLLARLHAGSWQEAQITAELADRTVFEELRLDPYYKSSAASRVEFRDALERLIQSNREHLCALVHADFSPKNILVVDRRLMLVDYETGHFGDPAFDLGFFTSHLVLKAIFHGKQGGACRDLATDFHDAYERSFRATCRKLGKSADLVPVLRRGIENLAGCLVARVDGKSCVEYLQSEQQKEQVRELARALFRERPESWQAALPVISKLLRS